MKQKTKQFYYFFSPKFQTLFLEYPVRFLPRYGEKKPAHQILYKVINENRATYRALLETFGDTTGKFLLLFGYILTYKM